MKAYVKGNTELGKVTRVYVTAEGQKRMTVEFMFSTVDADISKFEVV